MVKFNALKGLYETEKTIGCGGFAKVKLATHLATGEKVAIKIMDKTLLGDDLHRVTLELQALRSFSHNNICQLYQVMETDTHFFLVMEYCSGGELFDHIVEKNRLTEPESRTFFRQIVSAVAYLHSLGYAHRDLKPENVLLDKHQNLKLIDFGLCAKPEGGMENPLYTSCGSPTYAAPELVLGQQYLGQEVDVWAMGVLLYALLTGCLPFDDLNIESLYKKILTGKYDEPSFMSRESRKLIKSMLQVDPKKRVQLSQLLDHPWITLGVLEPVEYKTKISRKLDHDCLRVMAKYMEVDEHSLGAELKKWKYDYNTATYFLLLSRKKNGQTLKLNSNWKCLKNNEHQAAKIPLIELPVNVTPTQQVRLRRKLGHVSRSPNYLSPASPTVPGDVSTPSAQFLEPKPAYVDSIGRKAVKRPRSPGLMDDASPVPVKKATPGNVTPMKTPDSRKAASLNETPSGSARRMLGSIEKSLHKMRHVLTPKKPHETTPIAPVVLTSKDLCNVSTTHCKDPELVITELAKGLETKGITCKRKGFTLKGSLEPSHPDRFGGCSFQLEVCFLPSLGPPILQEKSGYFVGIRRKRLKGDSWWYKKVCEQVLALTSTGFSGDSNKLNGVALESAV